MDINQENIQILRDPIYCKLHQESLQVTIIAKYWGNVDDGDG